MAERGEKLTDREVEVLQEVAKGITNREVAQSLFISVNTVKVHLRNIYTKLGADSRTEATIIAVREGLVTVVEEGEESPEGVEPDEVIDEQPQVSPAPPLPWSKRVALIVALLLVVVGVALSWPHVESRDEVASGLPLARSAQTPADRATNASESPWNERSQMPTRRAYLALAAVGDSILAIGGRTPGGITGVVEAYDPDRDTWTQKREKPTPAMYVAGAVVGSSVYVPGGCDAAGEPMEQVEVYDAAADRWSTVSPMPEPRCAYALTVWEEEIYLFGGWNGERSVATVYVYDPEEDVWDQMASMREARSSAGAALLGERIYVVGGYEGERETALCEVYDPATDSWGTCASLSVGRGGIGLVGLGGKLYAIGGGGSTSYLGFNERYNPADDTWSAVETPLVGEWHPSVTVFDSVVYAIGGWNGDYLGLNQAYDILPFRIFIPVSQQN
jgi:DNA-binding CsgD family transcriptional regulator/N-acetylneuraminic acid mutarotase